MKSFRLGSRSQFPTVASRLALQHLELRLAPATFTVTNTDDSSVAGSGTLRRAIIDANNSAGADTVNFDASAFATAKTITLTIGDLTITDSLSIRGTETGSASPTISANGAFRVFEVDGSGKFSVTFDHLAITKGKQIGTEERGGAVKVQDESVTFTNCVLSDSTAHQGGLVAAIQRATLEFNNCTLSGGRATTSDGLGGAIYLADPSSTAGATVRITNSTLSGNRAGFRGGAIHFALDGNLTCDQVTFSDNQAATDVNGNASTGAGGAIRLCDATATIRNSTFTDNGCGTTGGGAIRLTQNGSLTLTSTIVAGNTATGGTGATPDVESINGGTVRLVDSIIGAGGAELVVTSNTRSRIGTLADPIDPVLSPLGNYGGPTRTHVPLPGSPAINTGSNTAGFTTDARGVGFSREFPAGLPDIGATEALDADPVTTTVTTLADTVDGTDGLTSLREAITAANVSPSSNTITFRAGLSGTITLASALPTLATSADIRGVGATVTVSGNGLYQPFAINYAGDVSTVAFSDLTITRGRADYGGAVQVFGENVSFTNCTLSDSFATYNGGLLDANGTATLAFIGCTLTGSKANYGGAMHLYEQATVTLVGTTLSGNKAWFGGAMHLNGGGNLTCDQVTFSGNQAEYSGGAVFAYSASTLGVNQSKFSNNSAGGGGGGVFLNATAILTVDKSGFSGNTAGYDGGAINLASVSTISVTNSMVASNSAGHSGGAVYLYDNSAVTVVASTLSGNAAGSRGGAVYFNNGGSLTCDQATFSGNSGANGNGALSLWRTATTIRSSTFTDNSAGTGDGGAFWMGAGPATITLVSTIIAGNAAGKAGPDINNPVGVVNATNCLIGVTGTGSGLTLSTDVNNQKGTTGTPLVPLLGPLADNGGWVQTHVPLAGSPAINTGSNTAGFTTDARGVGFSREFPAGLPDIGATEALDADPATITVTTLADTVDGTDGLTSLREAILAANTFPGGNTITFQAGLNGTIALTAGPDTITITQNVVIDASGSTVTVSGGGNVRPFIIGHEFGTTLTPIAVELKGLTITGGNYVYNGGGIYLGADSLTLTSVTVTGNVANRGGGISVLGGATLTLVNSVVSGNTAYKIGTDYGTGGGIHAFGAITLNVSQTTISNNTAEISGGAAFIAGASTLTVSQSTINNNTAVYNAGGINCISTSTVAITNSTFSGNVAGSAGGALYMYAGGSAVVTGSTFANNKADRWAGAVSLRGSFGTTGLSFTNSTFDGNAVTGNATFTTGGAIFLVNVTGSLSLVHSTVTGNTVPVGSSGAGVGVYGGAATVSAVNSIVAGNRTAASVPADFGSQFGTTVSATNLVYTGVTGGVTITGTATAGFNADANLSPLANNGGLTQTRALKAGSTAIDAGAATSPLTTDQRGAGFARVSNGKVDLGAYEFQQADTTAPTASGTFAAVTTRKGAAYTFTVTLADNVAVSASTVQGSDFTVTGPNGYSQAATLVSLSPAGNGSPLVATLSVAAPVNGAVGFDVSDNGTYTVMVTGSVLDVSGNAVKTGSVGTFAVQAPVSVQSVVTKLSDGTTTSLTTAGQRSVVPNLVVTYDGIATGANLAASYQLKNTGTNATVALTASTMTVNGKTVATITPVAPLANAYYTFTAFGTAITTANVSPLVVGLDGDDNGTAGGNFVLTFHRFRGDVTGDTAVDGDDLAQLAAAFNSVQGDSNYRASLDLDGDGAVDGNDLAVFAQSFAIGIL